MKLGETLYVTNRNAWRTWLAKNHKKAKEIWLVYYRKSSGKLRIPYNDAVEEALCFGWIDSICKRIDDECFAQRFSPRRPGSILSQTNRERIRKMVAAKRMARVGLNAVAHAFDHKTKEVLVIADDVLMAIKANDDAWRHFQKLPDSYKRIRISYIEDRRRYFGEEAFRRSLANFIKKTARNVRFGQFVD